MKLAEKLKTISRTDPMELYLNAIKRDMRAEAEEGGIYKIISVAADMYNDLCKAMMDEGFEIMIYNFKEDNSSYYVYIIWDKEKFDELIAQNESFTNKDVVLHYGLI